MIINSSFFAEDSEGESLGGPKLLQEDVFNQNIDKAKEDLAQQSHPQQKRALEALSLGGNNDRQQKSNSKDQHPNSQHISGEQSSGSSAGLGSKTKSFLMTEQQFNQIQMLLSQKTPKQKDSSDSDEDKSNSRDMGESCPYGCGYTSGASWLIGEHLKKCPLKGSSSGSNNNGPGLNNKYTKYLVKSHTRKVKECTDDNLNILSEARNFPASASLTAIYASMPVKAEPVRHNYNTGEFGLVINNMTGVLLLHDRTSTELLLQMFTDQALAKHETNKSWKPGKDGDSMLVRDEFPEIANMSGVLQALNNLRQINHKIHPRDSSAESLFNVVWKQSQNATYPPKKEDVTTLFGRWVQDRSDAASEGRPPMNFIQLQSHFSILCQRRGPSTSKDSQQESDRYKDRKQKSHSLKRRFDTKRNDEYDNNKPVKKRYVERSLIDNTCGNFNSPGGCRSQIPVGGSCMTKGGRRWRHVCNMYDEKNEKLCMKNHSIMEHVD